MSQTTSLFAGFAGGIAAALLFAAVLGGGPLAAPLFLLFPLPIAIIGFGWGTQTAIIAAGVGGLLAALASTPLAGVIFLILGAGPIALYAHLAGLARTENGVTEWFPLSALFTVMAALTPLTMLVVGYLIDMDAALLADQLTTAIMEIMQGEVQPMPPRAVMLEAMTFYVHLMPTLLAMIWFPMVLTNLWLGAKVAKMSDRLARPPQSIADSVSLPTAALFLFGVIIIVATLSNKSLLFVGVFLGTIFAAFAMIGLAVLHVKTRGKAWRGPALWLTYGATILFSLPLFPLALLGMAEGVWNWRGRNLHPLDR